jgi:hypothetical protein
MPVHVVKQGDSMTSIAEEYGFFWQTLWDHAENAELRELRDSPNVLMAGDQVFIPDKTEKEVTAATGKLHQYRRKGIPARLQLRIKDAEGQPRAGVGYTLTVDGREVTPDNPDEGFTTADDGLISHVISPLAKKAELELETGEQWVLNLGHVNPIEYTSGIQARLKNLGFFDGEESGELDDATRDAIRSFQTSQGLSVTGEPDEQTRNALVDAHES